MSLHARLRLTLITRVTASKAITQVTCPDCGCRPFADKLQVTLMMFSAVAKAADRLQSALPAARRK